MFPATMWSSPESTGAFQGSRTARSPPAKGTASPPIPAGKPMSNRRMTLTYDPQEPLADLLGYEDLLLYFAAEQARVRQRLRAWAEKSSLSFAVLDQASGILPVLLVVGDEAAIEACRRAFPEYQLEPAADGPPKAPQSAPGRPGSLSGRQGA
jgi:hypothetical protein